MASDPYVPQEVFTRAGVESVDFSELLKISDYISIHSPLLPETRNLFNADAFRQMKPTAYLINTARGPIVDEAALARALDAGQLAGAALDVMPQEPPVGSPLLGRDNVIVTPHTSFYSEESLVELQTKAAEEVVRAQRTAPATPLMRNPEVPCSAQRDHANAMRAMVLRAPGDLVLDDVARPRQDASQVQVRVTHSGICGTDYKIFSGAIPVSYPRIMGQ